jgi:hypothetical protein
MSPFADAGTAVGSCSNETEMGSTTMLAVLDLPASVP